MLLTCLWSIGLIWVSTYEKIGEKHIFWAIFGDMYRYTLNLYQYSLGSGRFWPTCTGTGQTCTGTPCSILTSFHILAITFSFLIRFKWFKWLIKLDFKENQISRNRNHQILILCGPKIHSKWGHVQANFWFCF